MPNAFTTQLLDMVQYTDYIATFADPARKLIEIEPYSYFIDGNVLPAPITQTASQTFDTQMQGDNDFVLLSMNQFARVAGATSLIVNPALLVQITERTTGRTFFSGPSPLPIIAGQGGFGFLMLGAKTIKARSTLRTTAISAQAQSFDGFYFAFNGYRLWYEG